MTESRQSFDAVIVGAGFAGMYMLHSLRELGLTAKVIEAGSDVGGTWYWNRYPGARCDVPSMEYSYSFSPELEQDWVWTEKYPPQPEVLAYASHVADRFDLRRDIQFDTRVTAAHFDDSSRRWYVSTDRGDELTAQFCIMATGCLSAPKLPEVPGIEDFEGDLYQTSLWPHEGVDLAGKRVAVIGTGSSGIQSIPLIAEQASHLTVFQRTPNFSLPAGNRPLTQAEVDELKGRYREYREAARRSGFGIPAEEPTKSALEVDDEEREQTYQAGWEAGSLVGLMLSYNDLLVDKEANDTAAEFVRRKIREIVKDPEVAETLCPTDHPLATKRPCLDTNYYATFNRDNVSLVNLRKTPIEAITRSGVRTTDATFDVDVIVFATGFDAMTGALSSIDIRGRGGRTLKDEWADGPQTYLGLSVAGFPNLFTITGPGSPSVLSNMMVSIEQHVEWIRDCIAYLREHGLSVIDATEEAQAAWGAHVAEAGQATLHPLANSWYMGANVPGKPRVFLPYIGGVGPYREICDGVAEKGYDGYTLSA